MTRHVVPVVVKIEPGDLVASMIAQAAQLLGPERLAVAIAKLPGAADEVRSCMEETARKATHLAAAGILNEPAAPRLRTRRAIRLGGVD